jgi:Zn finger protein HypA/HybF involved in hydrogenase expression
MANKQLNREVVAKALHESNKKRFRPIGKDETLSFDELEQEKLCEKCGKPLELNLWQNWECGYCLGYRVPREKGRTN